jgi:hypothetical protein
MGALQAEAAVAVGVRALSKAGRVQLQLLPVLEQPLDTPNRRKMMSGLTKRLHEMTR